MIQICLFGGVSAVAEDGVTIDVGPTKCQALLAALALSAGSAVPVSRLIDYVWDSGPPRTAEKTLQSYVTRLRKGLGAEAIVRTGAAYRLTVDPESVDVVRFQRRIESGDLRSALDEWTGTPLAGLEAGAFRATVEGLVEQRLSALEADVELRLERQTLDGEAGGPGRGPIVGLLTELTAEYPFREGLWALLMTALYQEGRQADALAAYRRARQHLVDQLGVEPGPRLQDLETSILGHDQQLTVGRTLAPGETQLPSGTVTFGFSDVEDSTLLWTRHRQEMAAAMANHDQLIRSTADDHGGYIFATGNDSFGVAFHRAADGIAWATDVQAALAKRDHPATVPIRVRIGLHTGETEERSKGYFGSAVIVAAKLAAAGHGGQTLVTEVTAALTEKRGLRELGVFRLDGTVGQHRVLQLGNHPYPPLRSEDDRRGNLPRRMGRLIGREADLESVAAALATSPVVTLVGPGGIGKTRLSLAAARAAELEMEAGAWLVELAAIASSDLVARAVADVLEISDSPGLSLVDAIVAALQTRRLLLVLDNCEHVVDGVAELADAIVERCGDVRILATSREGLALASEQLIAVAPLAPEGPGVELFNERAAAASIDFDAAASIQDVEEICRRLDGVPLAIELAAARTTSLSPAELVERLDDRLRLLTGGRRTSLERHRTLRTTIQWSYDLLAPEEQLLFRRLSIFAASFDLAAAEAVASMDGAVNGAISGAVNGAANGGGDDAGSGVLSPAVDVDHVLGGLVERSMLTVESGPFGRRFRLLETIRQFGAELLTATGETDTIAHRHAHWCLDRVNVIHRLLAGPDEIEGVARLGELWGNLRAAVDWALVTEDCGLARVLIEPIAAEIYLRNQSEIGEWAERLLAVTMAKPAPESDDDLILFGVIWAGRRYMQLQDPQGYERLLTRYGEPDHPLVRYGRAFVHSDYEGRLEHGPAVVERLRQDGQDYLADLFEVVGVAVTLQITDHLPEHDELVTDLVAQHRHHWPPIALNWALVSLGLSAARQGKSGEAAEYFADADRVAVPARTKSWSKPLQADNAARRGDRAQAIEVLRSYVDELIDAEDLYSGQMACMAYINVMTDLGHHTEAATILAHVETTGLLDASALRHAVSAAAEKLVAQNAEAESVTTGARTGAGAREALIYMRNSLAEIQEHR